MPAYPQLSISIVDIEDVAEAHLRAMLYPESDGERFLLTCCTMSFKEIADLLRKEFASEGTASKFWCNTK